MNDPSSDAHSHERVLAELLLAIEEADDRSAVIDAYVGRYPHLESQIVGLAQVDRTLESLAPDDGCLAGTPPAEGVHELDGLLERGDVLLTLGAGDVDRIGRMWLEVAP